MQAEATESNISTIKSDDNEVDWSKVMPLILTVLFGTYGWLNTPNIWMTLSISFFLGFIVHGILHMYFSHRAFKVGRRRQFVLALMGSLVGQPSPLVWATFHRRHHMHSDTEKDPHSPVTKSFFESFIGWAVRKQNGRWDSRIVSDLAAYPELRWLAKNQVTIFTLFVLSIMICSGIYYRYALHLSPLKSFLYSQVFIANYYSAPILLSFINSSMVNTISHMWGTQDHVTKDASTNNIFFGIVSLGSAWHNNHHAHPQYINCGHKWWQTDITYYVIWIFHKLRLVDSMNVYKPTLKNSKRP